MPDPGSFPRRRCRASPPPRKVSLQRRRHQCNAPLPRGNKTPHSPIGSRHADLERCGERRLDGSHGFEQRVEVLLLILEQLALQHRRDAWDEHDVKVYLAKRYKVLGKAAAEKKSKKSD